jgi:heme O synthase-like polyprenyltransferase
MDTMEDVIKYGSDMGNTFLLTGTIAGVVWLQNIHSGVAPLLLITGGFIVIYTNWLKRRNKKKE